MLGAGVEPAPTCVEGILSPQCLPFHHPSDSVQDKCDNLAEFAIGFKRNYLAQADEACASVWIKVGECYHYAIDRIPESAPSDLLEEHLR